MCSPEGPRPLGVVRCGNPSISATFAAAAIGAPPPKYSGLRPLLCGPSPPPPARRPPHSVSSATALPQELEPPFDLLSSASDHSSLRGPSEQSTGVSIDSSGIHNADSSGSHPLVQSQGHILAAVSEPLQAPEHHQNIALGSSQSTDLHQFINQVSDFGSSIFPNCPGPSMCQIDTTSSADLGATPIFERSVDSTYITQADLEHPAPIKHITPCIISSSARLQT